jgi:cytochrome c553
LNNRDTSPWATSRRRWPGAALLLSLACTVSAASWAQDAQKLAATVCVACHGPDGNSGIPMFPKIAGQQADYLIKQLRDFQTGRRKSDVMAPVVATLKLEDIIGLAEYYSRQKVKPTATGAKQSVAFGKLVYLDGDEEAGVPACIGCHKPGGVGHLVYPRIGGQHVQYVTQQLKNFATGDRNNDVSRFMRVVSKRMTEEEIQSVAEYLAGLDEK